MKNINIPENTDLNDLIESINTSEDAALLNESTLMFDQSIYALLPYPLNKIVEVIDNPQKRDIALITSLTVLGSILRNYTVQHRDNVEGCQLSTYILGNASSGKGFATKWRAVGKEYHNVQVEKYRQNLKDYKLSLMEFKRQERDDEPIKPKRNYLFLSPDITKASLVQELAENEGYGLLFAPEADTIIKASQGEHGGFSDLLRTSFHGEPHSTNRKSFEEGPIEINNVRFGILLTSTLDQCFRLIPNYENGLFSRFIYYLLSAENKYVCEAPEEQGEKLNKQIDREAEHIDRKFIKIKSNITGEKVTSVTGFYKQIKKLNLSKRLSKLKSELSEEKNLRSLFPPSLTGLFLVYPEGYRYIPETNIKDYIKITTISRDKFNIIFKNPEHEA